MTKKVFWINLQGADWDVLTPFLLADEMPHLARLIDTGASGQLFAVPPRRYPTSAISLATGTGPEVHTVVSSVVANEDGAMGIRAADRSDWKVPPVWETAASAGVPTVAIGWPATHPAAAQPNCLTISDVFALADGAGQADWTCDPASLSDPNLLDDLKALRMHPQDITAKMLVPLLGALDTIDLKHDERMSTLIEALARALTLHRVANWAITQRPWQFIALNFDFIDQLSQVFLQYQAPRMGHVTRADHARYAGVVSAAYRYFDQMLGAYVKAAGADGNIVITSDHGYLTGPLRKRPAEVDNGRSHNAYRDMAVFCAAGPAFVAGAAISGAKTTAVAATLLRALGVSGPQDTAHLGINAALTPSDQPLTKAPQPSHHPAGTVAEATAKRVLAFLQRRGFMQGLPGDRDSLIETLQSTALTRLAQCNIAAQNTPAALAQLAKARTIAPGMTEAHVLTAQCGVAAQDWGLVTEALDTLDALGAEVVMTHYWRARVAVAKGETQAAKSHLETALAQADDTREGSRLLESVGTAFLNMQAVDQAQDAFTRALQINPVAPRACTGLGSIHLTAKAYDKACACFDTSLGALQQQPRTHALRGFALLGLGQGDAARAAFDTALQQDPALTLAQQGLKRLLQQGTEAAADLITAKDGS